MKKFALDFIKSLTTFIWIASTTTSALCIAALVVGNREALPILYFSLPLSIISTFLIIRYKWMKSILVWFFPRW